MVITSVVVVDPEPLDAVTVYVVAGLAMVGVPVIAPVLALNTKPAGKAGAMLYVSPVGEPDKVGARYTVVMLAI